MDSFQRKLEELGKLIPNTDCSIGKHHGQPAYICNLCNKPRKYIKEPIGFSFEQYVCPSKGSVVKTI